MYSGKLIRQVEIILHQNWRSIDGSFVPGNVPSSPKIYILLLLSCKRHTKACLVHNKRHILSTNIVYEPHSPVSLAYSAEIYLLTFKLPLDNATTEFRQFCVRNPTVRSIEVFSCFTFDMVCYFWLVLVAKCIYLLVTKYFCHLLIVESLVSTLFLWRNYHRRLLSDLRPNV